MLDSIDRLQLRETDDWARQTSKLLLLGACNMANDHPASEPAFTGLTSLFGVRCAIGKLVVRPSRTKPPYKAQSPV